MRSFLFLVAVLATPSTQAPAYIYGTTLQIHEASFLPTKPPQFYSAGKEGKAIQTPVLVEPELNFPNDQANLYDSSGKGTPLRNAIAPPSFVEGHVPLAVSPVLSQYQTQYVDGRYDFGYAGGPNSRTETRDVSGTVRGAYTYVDAFGNVQSRRYVADDWGFRAKGTDLPKATFEIEDTPEVKEAKETLRKAYEQAGRGSGGRFYRPLSKR